jgi:glycosyltransferase involved in cell wall biosynthesis
MTHSSDTIAFVTPRYGVDILGGAERHARSLAEQLVQGGWKVEALTTCTESLIEIRNTLPAGTSEVNGVTVRRFPADQTDIARYHRVAALAQSGAKVSYSDQLEFMRHSINSGPLYEYLRTHADKYRCVVFAPYLFGTTYWGIQAVPHKAILMPCLHDEPYAYFDLIRDMFEQVQGIFFNTPPEYEFARTTLGLVNPNAQIVGMEFPDQPKGDGEGFRAKHQLKGNVLLYTGRLEEGKNIPLLIEYFTRYSDEQPGTWTLAITGRGPVEIPKRPDLVYLGMLPEEEMSDLSAACTLFCLPSLNESMSIVLMETWLQDRPVLVHADCAVTDYHVKQSQGGLAFNNYESFKAALNQIAAEPETAHAMGQRGHAYVQRTFNSEAVYARLTKAISDFTAPRSLYDQLSQQGIVHARSFSRERFDERFEAILKQVEAETAGQGLTPQQISALRQAALVGMPDYQVQSGAPFGIGKLVVWLRNQLTSHLREPYLDPIIARQEQYNRQLLDAVLPALERSVRSQQRLERQVRMLEQQLSELQSKRDSGEKA